MKRKTNSNLAPARKDAATFAVLPVSQPGGGDLAYCSLRAWAMTMDVSEFTRTASMPGRLSEIPDIPVLRSRAIGNYADSKRKTKMNAKTLEAIKRHGETLLAMFPNSTERDPIALCKKLRRVENSLAKPLTDYCNGVNITSEELDEVCDTALIRVRKILGFGNAPERKGTIDYGLFVNRDPRGYALKLDYEKVREYNRAIACNCHSLYTDMGGYGILAPDLTVEKEAA